jgi:hypothetical protein
LRRLRITFDHELIRALLRVGLACVWCSFGIACSNGADGVADMLGMSGSSADVKLTTYPGVGHDAWTMTYNLSNRENDILHVDDVAPQTVVWLRNRCRR